MEMGHSAVQTILSTSALARPMLLEIARRTWQLYKDGNEDLNESHGQAGVSVGLKH